jgi:DNA-binding NtrC family response regulator
MVKKDKEASGPQMEKYKNNASRVSCAVILVVDDDPLQRNIIQTILSDEGYQAYVASSAEEALIAAQTLNPHVVLTDLRMHKMDGMKLMEKLRSEKDAPEVIIMSAFGTPYMIEELLKKGAFSFMEKPLEKNRMLHHINSALEIATKMKPTAERAKGDQRAADVLPSGTIAGIAS